MSTHISDATASKVSSTQFKGTTEYHCRHLLWIIKWSRAQTQIHVRLAVSQCRKGWRARVRSSAVGYISNYSYSRTFHTDRTLQLCEIATMIGCFISQDRLFELRAKLLGSFMRLDWTYLITRGKARRSLYVNFQLTWYRGRWSSLNGPWILWNSGIFPLFLWLIRREPLSPSRTHSEPKIRIKPRLAYSVEPKGVW
jgi:hypothetical protein